MFLIWTLKSLRYHFKSSHCSSLIINVLISQDGFSIQVFQPQIPCVFFTSPSHVSCPSNNRDTGCFDAPFFKVTVVKFLPSSLQFSPTVQSQLQRLFWRNHVRHTHNFEDTQTNPHTQKHTYPNTPHTTTPTHAYINTKRHTH